MKTFTREEYLNGACTHREYYSQYVTGEQRTIVKYAIGIDRLKASKDEHLNDIPLTLWDRIAERGIGVLGVPMKKNGDYLTLAGQVCILKEAARQLIEKHIEEHGKDL